MEAPSFPVDGHPHLSSMTSQQVAKVEAPKAVHWIARRLEDAGFETWAVGGAVRDAVLGIPSDDWDLATRARPDDVRRLFPRTVPIGLEHGTVGVLARDRVLYEVTTFRRDVVPLGRRAIVEFADDLMQDLSRRDFTFNAIAWHPIEDEWSDPFHGIEDLRAGILRTVGSADDRFREDHLRILRALRFAGSLGLTIAASTWRALRRARSRTVDLSAERVQEELWKVLGGATRPSRALGLYRLSGVLGVLFPEIEEAVQDRHSHGDEDPWGRALLTVDRLSSLDPALRLAALLWVVGARSRSGVTDLCRRLRFSNAVTDRISAIVDLAGSLPDSSDRAPGVARRRWLSRTGSHDRSLMKLALAGARERADRTGNDPGEVIDVVRAVRREAQTAPPLSVAELAIDGTDLIALGLEPGPDFARILRGLLAIVLENPELNTPEALSRLALELEATGGMT